MSRALVPATLSALLAVALLAGAPAPVLADPQQRVGLGTRSVSDLPDIPVTVPSVRARAAASGSVPIGMETTITWADESFDDSLQSYVAVLSPTNALEGQGYQLRLTGLGPLSAYVVDAEGEPIAYSEHPDADMARPTLEWEFMGGDRIVLISDPLPLAAPTATLRVTDFDDVRAPVVDAEALLPYGATLSGKLAATDPHLPFHGGHFSQRWIKPVTATAGQDKLALTFAGSAAQTDWLSVVVLDADRAPVREIPVRSGIAAFSLADDESFVVTSVAPDDFGSYAFEWMLLGSRGSPGSAIRAGGTTFRTSPVTW